MNFKIFLIPSVYTIWDGLSLKTISRYCPWKKMNSSLIGAVCWRWNTRCRKNWKFPKNIYIVIFFRHLYINILSNEYCRLKLWKVQKNASFLSVFSNCEEPNMCICNSESKQMLLEVLNFTLLYDLYVLLSTPHIVLLNTKLFHEITWRNDTNRKVLPNHCVSLSKSIWKTLKASLRAAIGVFIFTPINFYE